MERQKKVLIFQGGWDGHEPVQVAARFARIMEKHGYVCEIHGDQEALLDAGHLMEMDLIIPCWTMGSILQKARENIVKAVAAGCGLAGCHGGMCDAFREDVEWQFMTGGQWVSHPGGDGVRYQVNIRAPSWRESRTSRSAASIIICMWIRRLRFWQRPDFRQCPIIIFPINRWICRWPGRSSGETAGYFIIPWDITMMCLKSSRRRRS